MTIKELKKNKNFYLITQGVINKSSSQKKKILKFISTVDRLYFIRAETFATSFLKYLEIQKIDFKYAINAYLKLCINMMTSQKYFLKNKKYPVDNEKLAYKNVYGNIKEMKSYMIGLAISQFLWPTHYAMYSFFIEKIKNRFNEYNKKTSTLIKYYKDQNKFFPVNGHGSVDDACGGDRSVDRRQ